MNSSGFALAVGALGVIAACGPIDAPAGPAAPINACPSNPCSAYVQLGASPTCIAGACVVAAETSDLIVVVSLPEDSYFAPGRTFALTFKDLMSQTSSSSCLPPACVHLPKYGVDRGVYLISPHVAKDLVQWNLGNQLDTALPVRATYRPLWGPSGVDPVAVGLPIDPVEAQSVTNPLAIGPGNGPGIEFQAYLAPGTYVRKLLPDPPWDQAFAPEIRQVPVLANQESFDSAEINGFEATTWETGLPSGQGPTIPTFDISRADGPLDGWTAYLRDSTTKEVISSVRPLSGSKATGVILATNDQSPERLDAGALYHTELVLAPPPGAFIPNFIAAPQGQQEGPRPAAQLASKEVFPSLPAPAVVEGSVSGPDGAPMEADLVFEAPAVATPTVPLSILDGQGNGNNTNFEYVGRANARADPTTGVAGFSTHLPPGQYRLTIVPLAGAGAVTIMDPQSPPYNQAFAVDVQGGPVVRRALVLDSLREVRGRVTVADGRPLVGAIVQAVPTQCYAGSSTWCFPRGAQTTTQDDGSFAFRPGLDPGGYSLRVRPAEGTRLPWVVQALTVEALARSAPMTPAQGPVITVPDVVVPAPVSVGLQLFDPGDNAVIGAVVRVFSAPPPATGSPAPSASQQPQGAAVPPDGGTPASPPAAANMGATQAVQAVEVGEAITDETGRYDLYVAPPRQ